MRRTRSDPARAGTVWLTIAVMALAAGSAFAAVGLAEWEITTPGGNRISHIDPLKERYGTCLRRADQRPGLVSTDPAAIYVDHLEWWTYYTGFVVGRGSTGFLSFDAATAAVDAFTAGPEMP